MSSQIIADFSECEGFVNRLATAGPDFKKELKLFLIGLGEEFLRVVQDEIIAREVVDTRLLLNSFSKGGAENVWKLDEGGLTVEVGTNVEYAEFVNDGHWTNSKGQSGRWIPGSWNGSHFEYQPGAKTGMYLRQQWVEGAHYWDIGLKVMEQMIPGLVDKKVEAWLQSYFAGFI
ncbi:MAG: HK97 gp10 family phage protein [Eubacterium sp.]|nr:HK97 gp10 family phage protein [Eubacterium sp.]MBR1761914.1 HK97 gp10 family phage protein [Eubacterium sp.]